MTYAVLEPSLFSMSEGDWEDVRIRDEKLSLFLDIVSSIDQIDSWRIAWSDVVEGCIWRDPSSRPWRRCRSWSNTIMPVIAKKFLVNVDRFETGRNGEVASNPEMHFHDEDMGRSFFNLMVAISGMDDELFVCYGLDNYHPKKFSFHLDGLPFPKRIGDVYSRRDILNGLSIEENYWPRSAADKELFSFGVRFVLERDYNITSECQEFYFSDAFIEKIVAVATRRDKVFGSIARRISMSSAEAGRDPQLQDEALIGRTAIRRFRVTQRPSSNRIHYEFNNGMHFIMYYGDGEHDDGL